MSAILAFLTSALGKYIALALVTLTAAFTAYRSAFKAGRDNQIAKDAKSADTARTIEADNARLSDEQVKERLKAKWQKL